jgi:hypothetical protein
VQNQARPQPISNNVLNQEKEIEILKKDYEIESLKLELQRIMDEKNILTHKIFELETEIEKKDEIIAEFKQKQALQEKTTENLSREKFLLHLGTEVAKRCEKAEKEGEKNGCKELYFKFVNEQ